ncbi:hypothetical protein HY250_03235 [Candidatus Azambacteria bacterium]|nr:hypothetical protein [Candidatus Azambacteria bacterium]
MGIQQGNTSKSALLEIIAVSSLPETQKTVWSAFINAATEKEIIPILDALASDADTLSFLTENLMAKMEAMSKKDVSLWGKIIEEEKAHLHSRG